MTEHKEVEPVEESSLYGLLGAVDRAIRKLKLPKDTTIADVINHCLDAKADKQIPSEVKAPQDLLDIRDINERLLEELSNRFKLRTGDLNSLTYDDTQRGVEFAFEYLTPYLKAKPAILKD